MKKNLINEDIRKMMGLISYDRGKTLTENKERNEKRQLNEIFNYGTLLAAAGLGYLTGNAIAPALKAVAGKVTGALKGYGGKMAVYLGASSANAKSQMILNPKTWSEIQKQFNALETQMKVPKGTIKSKIKTIGTQGFKDKAAQLYSAMDGLDPFDQGEKQVKVTFKQIPTLYDMTGVAVRYGVKDGQNLYQWIKGDGLAGFAAADLKDKPMVNYNRKNYSDLESFTAAVMKDLKEVSRLEGIKAKGQDEEQKAKDKAEMVQILVAKFGECVRGPLEEGEVKYHSTSGRRNIRIREAGLNIAVFDNGKIWDGNKPSGQRTGGSLEPCEAVAAEEEVNERYYFGGQLSEQFRIREKDGTVRTVGVERAPKPEDSSGSEESGGRSSRGSSGGGSSYTRTDVTYEDVAAGKGEFKKGDRGDGVKKAQEALNKSDKVNPKLKVDGIFGSKTEAAIGQVGGEKVFNKAVIDMLGGGKPADDQGAEVDTAKEEQEQKQAEAQAAQMSDEQVVKFVEENKVKELDRKACKALMSTTAKMIKKRPNDPKTKELLADAQLKTTLGNCFNDNLFDFGIPGRRVRQAFKLKEKGN